MEIKLTLALPRDAASVPVARRVLAGALRALGVEEDAVSDIELALTEAATNVLDHAEATDDYEISAGVHGNMCILEVVDHGTGFDSTVAGFTEADAGAEGGRGIQIMRALVDRVSFIDVPHAGTIVHLEKELRLEQGSLLERLALDGSGRGPWSESSERKGQSV